MKTKCKLPVADSTIFEYLYIVFLGLSRVLTAFLLQLTVTVLTNLIPALLQ